MSETRVNSPLIRQRDYWYDNAKAFLIICVVIGHLANGIFSTSTPWVVALQKFIYVFHMPAFMIVSGRFAKKRIDRNDWQTTVSKVLVPYLIFQTAMLVVYSALGATPAKFNYLNPLFGLWYFLNIAVYTLITPYLKKFKWLFPVSIVAALAVGFFFSTLFGAFHRFVCFYPFFLFGYYTQKLDFSFCKKPWFRIISYVMFCAIGIYVLKNVREVSFNLLCMNKTYHFVSDNMKWTMLETFGHTVLRYVLGFATFFMVMGMVPAKKQFFSYIGIYSVYVYVLHSFLIVILREVDADYDILRILTNKWLLLAYCFSGVPLSFILASKPVRKLTSFFVEPKFDLARITKKLAGTEKTEEVK